MLDAIERPCSNKLTFFNALRRTTHLKPATFLRIAGSASPRERVRLHWAAAAMYILLQFMVLTGLLLLANEALRRATPWVVWSAFLLLPFVLTPYWLEINELGLFSWFKYYTVFFCVCWGTALRFTSLGDRAWARCTIPLLLAVNISEAAAVDFLGQGSAHALNAAAGLLLIATLPYGYNCTHIDSASDFRDLHYRISERWVIGYTIWNWTFVYLNYPALAGHHTAVLAAGLIVALHDPRRWSQARAATLGVSLLITATDFQGMVGWMDTTSWYSQQTAILAAGLSAIFMACIAVSSLLPQFALGDNRLRRAVDRLSETPGKAGA